MAVKCLFVYIVGIMAKALKINQVQKTKIYKDIIEQLKRFILSGHLKEGNRLPTEREFANQFAVSRVSVRQALTVLHEMGLIEGRPGGGTFVSHGIRDRIHTPITATLLAEKELLAEPLEVRRLIEPEITRLAALRATAKNVKAMERILVLQEAKAKDNLPITEEDTLFHEEIAKATGNSILIKLVQSLHHYLKASRHQSLIAPGGNQRSISDHRKIFAAVAAENSPSRLPGDGRPPQQRGTADISGFEKELYLTTEKRSLGDQPATGRTNIPPHVRNIRFYLFETLANTAGFNKSKSPARTSDKERAKGEPTPSRCFWN